MLQGVRHMALANDCLKVFGAVLSGRNDVGSRIHRSNLRQKELGRWPKVKTCEENHLTQQYGESQCILATKPLLQ